MITTRTLAAFILALVFATALIGPAAADVGVAGTGEFDGGLNVVPVSDDSTINGALVAADKFWTRLGFAPGKTETYLYDDVNPDADARGDVGGTRLWVTRRMRSTTTWRFLGVSGAGRKTSFDRASRRLMLVAFCSSIAHERGHNLGLSHDDWRPIMHHDRTVREDAPRECFEWAAHLVPEPRSGSARHRARDARRGRANVS